MERFVPDIDKMTIGNFLLGLEGEGKKVVAEQAAMRARFALACAAIGEYPLHDNRESVGLWAAERMIERSEGEHGRGGHRSDIRVVRENQDLWGIGDRKTLAEEMKKRLAGVRTKLTYGEELRLERCGVDFGEGD